MSFSKLKRIHVIIIGIVLCIIAGVAVFFLQIKPQMEAFKVAKARYDKAVVKGNPASRDSAKRDLAKAVTELAVAQAQLDVQMKKRMPDLNFSRRDIGMLALWKEQIKTLGPLLESFAHDKNVKVLQAGFQIQAPPSNPNDPIFDQDVLVFPLGSVAVSGGFKPLMDNVRRWNNCRRLVMVGVPTLVGISPQLTEVYSVTCYVFPAAKGGSKIVMAGGNAAAPGAPTPTQ
jgi:hypothetical protein